MGQGGSKTTSEVLTGIAVDVAQSSLTRCVQSATQSQLIAVKNVVGDVNISGIKFAQGAAIKMECVTNIETNSQIQETLSNEIAQWASSEGVAVLSALGGNVAMARSIVRGILTANVKMDTASESIMQAMQKQKLIVANVGGSVVISDISMSQGLDIGAKALRMQGM